MQGGNGQRPQAYMSYSGGRRHASQRRRWCLDVDQGGNLRLFPADISGIVFWIFTLILKEKSCPGPVPETGRPVADLKRPFQTGMAAGLLFIFFALLCPVQAKEGLPQFTVGVVPQFETRVVYEIWEPILAELSRRTGCVFTHAGAPSIAAFEKAFMAGAYDLAYMNPYHFVVAEQTQGYLPLVRDVGRSLYGVLVVEKKSGISQVSQLAGKVIAFPSPNALGASLQMRQELRDVFGLSFTPRYVNTHDSVYLNVILGTAAAGGGVQKTLDQQRAEYRERLTIIHTTRPVPPHPIAIHPRVAPEVRDRILNALLAMGGNPQDRSLLAKVPISIIGRALPSDYAPLKAMKLERFYIPPE